MCSSDLVHEIEVTNVAYSASIGLFYAYPVEMATSFQFFTITKHTKEKNGFATFTCGSRIVGCLEIPHLPMGTIT